MENDIISMTIQYKGWPIKIENGKIYLRAFGTTIYDHSMHWSWMEVKVEDLKDEMRNYLKGRKLI
jgi:predicted heme/steroid binding protein